MNPVGTAGGPRGMEIVGRGGGGKDQVGKVLVIDGVGKTFCEPDEKFGGWTWLKGELNWIRLVSAAVAGARPPCLC